MNSSYLPYRDKSLPNILVFDSGVGGLTITKEIAKLIPRSNITFAADNAAFPYGTKKEQDLVARISLVLNRLQVLTDADIIVVACNSASTLALPKLRQTFSVPIVGVVPAIKPAAKLTQSKVIGLLATPGTITRDYTDNLIKDFAENCAIVRVGSNKLVHLAEQKLMGKAIEERDVDCELGNFHQAMPQGLDTIVLACTHFPLLVEELQRCLPSVYHWIDSGSAIANRVKVKLGEDDRFKTTLEDSDPTTATYQSIFTAKRNNVAYLNNYLKSWFSESSSVISI